MRAGLGVDYACPQGIFDQGSAERDRLEIALNLQLDSDHENDSQEDEAGSNDDDTGSDSA